MDEKNNENSYIDNQDNNLKGEEESNNKIDSVKKEQLNHNDINIYLDILDKLKVYFEEKNVTKRKNKEKKSISKKINNIDNNDNQLKNDENININIISYMNKINDLFSKKYVDEEDETNLNLKDLLYVMKNLQITFNSNIEIFKKIEFVCDFIINNIKDKEQKQSFFEIMIEGLNYNEDSSISNNLIISLKLVNNILKKNSFLVEAVYDVIINKIYDIIKLYKNNDEMVFIFCFKILILFISNDVFSFDLVNNSDLLLIIKDIIYKIRIKIKNIYNKEIINGIINEKGNNNEYMDINSMNINDLVKQIYILLIKLTKVDNNLLKISEVLMETLLNEFLDDYYGEDQNINIKVNFFELLLKKEQKNIDTFIKYKGIECILKILKINEKNINVILILFNIINMILKYNKAYNEIMIKLKLHEYINDLVKKKGIKENEIDFKGKSLLFLINFEKEKLEKIQECDFNDIKSVKASDPPPHVKNFLNNGKMVKIVNDLGEIKKKYLYFTQDFLKVIAKNVKSNLPPKQKYIIETVYITSVVKGYGTDVFKKSKRFYRGLPELNKCFSIISLNPTEGQKSINVICEKESEVDKWINFIKIIIGYLQDNKRIKKNITFNSN